MRMSHFQQHGLSVRRSVALVGCLGVFAAAAVAGGLQYEDEADVAVLENTPERIVVEYDYADFIQTSVDINGQKFTELSFPHEPQLHEAGAPALPFVPRSVILADELNYVVAVDEAASTFYELYNIDVAPSKGHFTRDIDPASVPYLFDEALYRTDAFYPGQLAALGQPYIMRDYRGAVINTYPLQYNPVTRTLRVYTSMVVEVVGEQNNAQIVNPMKHGQEPRALSLAFHDLYEQHFINYGSAKLYDPMDEEGELLIICHDAWLGNIQPLVDHKNAIGITTTAVGVSTIGNNATSIKNYIQDVYNSSDLAFVLLVGDSGQVATPYASGGASDPSYSKLVGGDDYPEIMIGRFSAENASQVDTQVQRTIAYETPPFPVDQDWYWRGVGIASSQGAGQGDEGQADYVHMDEIRDWLMGVGYTTVNQIYDTNGGNASDVTAALNDGRGVINYCGHGSTTSWSTTGFSNSHINSLQNAGMLPFIVSVACVNGNFDGATCFAEAWLRATDGGEPTGAIGAYMSSINQSWAPPMEGQDEFNLLLTAGAYNCYGTLCYAGSCSMMDAYGGSGVSMFDTWHVFGDPSLRVVGTPVPPEGLGVSGSAFDAAGQQGGPIAPESMTYTLTNYDETPLEYAVTVDGNWLRVVDGSGTIPALGETTVTVELTALAFMLGNGEYTATIMFDNVSGEAGDTARDATLTIGVPTVQYAWDMDTNPGWSVEGQWEYGQPLGGGGQYGGPDPTSGHTGLNVIGYNLEGDYTNGMPEFHLTTDAIDCSNLSQVSLRFWRWLGVETSYYDHAYIRVSNDGLNWTTIWENDGAVTDSSWNDLSYDISDIADNEAMVYVRWTMGTTDSSWRYCGWNIDDVEIWGLAATSPTIPGDMDCSGAVDFDDISPFVLAMAGVDAYAAQYPDCNWLNGDMNGDNNVDFDDINPFVALLSELFDL